MVNENTYCVKEKKFTGNDNIRYITLSNGRKVIISRRLSCGSKKSTFI